MSDEKEFRRHAAKATSTSQYPNLGRYLRQLRLAFRIILALAILASLALTTIALTALYTGLTDNPDRIQYSPILLTFLSGVSTLAVGYIYYLIAMATIEFVKVVIDIESNTRRQ